MKRIVMLIISLFILTALFSGCGKAPIKEVKEDNKVSYENAQYSYAAGKFKTDENGLAAEKYDYPLPLTNTNERLRYWTCCYAPDYLPAEYGDSPFPVEIESKTGVDIEYLIISPNGRSENFAVLLATDDLPDIMSQASYYYRGDFRAALNEERYFVNLYNYRDYMPNYIYEVMKDAKRDRVMYNSVFLDSETIGAFICLKDDIYPPNGLFVRGDWLKKVGMDSEDIVTWDDTYNMLKAFKSQIDTAKFPSMLFRTINGGTNHWLCFDTASYIDPHGVTVMVDDKGKVYAGSTTDRDYDFMSEIHKWYSEELFDPNWMSFENLNSDGYRMSIAKDQMGYAALPVQDIIAQPTVIDDPDCSWLPLKEPVLKKGQKLHVGDVYNRTYYGNASVSAKSRNIELAVTWLDWRYSPQGSEVMSYGAEGYAWEYNEKGEKQVSEFIYNNPDSVYSITMLTLNYCNDILYDPGLEVVFAHYKYPGGEQVIACYEYFKENDNNDYAYNYPIEAALTGDSLSEAQNISNDLMTYISENYLAFVDGSRSLSDWGDYTKGLDKIGLNKLLGIYQEAYDEWKNTAVEG